MANSITVVKDILEANWNAANTSGIKPTIDFITTLKRSKYKGRGTATGRNAVARDTVLIYKSSGVAIPEGGNEGIRYTDRVSIDCRSMFSGTGTTWQEHGQEIEDEVLRIIEGKRQNPLDPWTQMIPLQPLDLDDKSRRRAKRVIDVQLMRLKCEITI